MIRTLRAVAVIALEALGYLERPADAQPEDAD